MNSFGRSKIEVLIVSIVVILTVVLALGIYAGRTNVYNGKRLINELSAIRSAISSYTIINKALPPSLKSLIELSYDAGDGSTRPFLEGSLIDPFGNPYNFDPKTGFVGSTTPGYKNW